MTQIMGYIENRRVRFSLLHDFTVKTKIVN